MKTFLTELRSAVAALLMLAIVCCGLYPIAVWAVAQLTLPDKANGSLIVDRAGAVRGSALLGQGFHGEMYFHPRPSAAGNGYDASNSGGSNLGPTSGKLHSLLTDRVAEYRRENGLKETDVVPADAVTASASGLDPHISARNAGIQVARIARVRGLSREQVQDLIRENTDAADLGFLGEPGVNVVRLNLALDSLGAGSR